MARIIIFGGQGYLGQNIINLLRGNHEFLTLGRGDEKLFNELDYQHLSIYDSSLKEKLILFNADHFIVSYYGNPSSKDIETYQELNKIIRGIFQLLPKNTKLVFLSTQLVYGKGSTFYNQEQSLISPVESYPRMCSEFENEVIKLSTNNHLILRVPIVYGGERNINKGYKNIVSAFMGAAIKGDKLDVYGGGSQTRSFIHIEDFSLLLNKILTDGTDVRILNTCFDEHYSIRELATQIAFRFNTECDIKSNWPSNINPNMIYDIRLDSSESMNLVKNYWNLNKYLNSIDE